MAEDILTQSKTCYSCHAIKAVDEFAPDGHGRRLNMCRTCRSEYCKRKIKERSLLRGGLKMSPAQLVNAVRVQKDHLTAIIRNSSTQSPSGCSEWIARKDKHGYGKVFIYHEGNRAEVFAHRLVLGLRGEIDISNRSVCVLHRCDNPACCNPEHLFTGTQADNIHDCIAKGRKAVGRGPRGERTHSAKLTESQIVTLRSEYVAGVSRKHLAKEYGVSIQTVFRVGTGRNWKHLK